MDFDQRIVSSVTRQCKAIFPGTLNANDTLFGGQAMKWMDEVAYITATRFTRKRMFTVSTDRVKFLKAVESNTIVEVVGSVIKAGPVKLVVKVEIFAEEMYSEKRYKAVEGFFVLTALDANNRIIRMQEAEICIDG